MEQKPAPCRLQLPREIYEEMVRHATREVPKLCVGVLAGMPVESRDGTPMFKAVHYYPLVNVSDNPLRYEAGAHSLFNAYRDMRVKGTTFVARFHSVIEREPIPSKLDIQCDDFGPEIMRLLISVRRDGTVTKMRGWWLEEGLCHEVLDCGIRVPLSSTVEISPSVLAWNGGAVGKFARAIYEEGCFGDLPILADMLEEAGCCDPAILSHCRQPGQPHARGCWVVDLILSKYR
jgi:proteasome lid subunit RPN8/RPN11